MNPSQCEILELSNIYFVVQYLQREEENPSSRAYFEPTNNLEGCVQIG